MSILAKNAEKHRKLTRQVTALKKECDVILQELEATAKGSKNKLKNGEFVVSFKNRLTRILQVCKRYANFIFLKVAL